MSLDDYAKFITQKYTLAAAIAVIKTKPNNLTMAEYIHTLKEDIKEKNHTSDSDVTFCSEDFDISNEEADTTQTCNDYGQMTGGNDVLDDSVTILRDFDDAIGLGSQNDEGIVNVNEAGRMVGSDMLNNGDLAPNVNICDDVDMTQADNDIETFCQNTTVLDNNLTDLSGNTESNPNVGPNLAINDKYITTSNVITNHLGMNQYKSDANATIHKISRNIKKTFEIKPVNDARFIPNNNIQLYKRVFNTKELLDSSPIPIDSQETMCYTPRDLSDNLTHVSQSQIAMVIPRKYLYATKDDKLTSKYNTKSPLDIETTETEFENVDVDLVKSSRDIDRTENNNSETNSNKFDINSYVIDEYLNIDTVNRDVPFNANIDKVYSINLSSDNNNGFKEETDMFDDISTSQKELIPFKVIEELNKIKCFLRKFDRNTSEGFSSDSGYRSDSQSKSRNGLQLSGTWINQSGHCLFSFLSQCPLVDRTEDISNEISAVLGQYIDRLHDEEKYPSFLEDFLEHVDSLLKNVFGVNSQSENELLLKDECIQRVLLLNQSGHLLKFSIHRITDILDNIYTEMAANDENFEINNITALENLAYLFNILEVLIRRYIRKKGTFSQTQSQDGGTFKRSSITDIWRKKWNPNSTESRMEGGFEKCVLSKCSEVLNKLIVKCVDNFSLIAYAALQCFNSVQN